MNNLRDVSKNNDFKRIVFEDYEIAQYVLANNTNVLNNVHSYSQFKVWKF